MTTTPTRLAPGAAITIELAIVRDRPYEAAIAVTDGTPEFGRSIFARDKWFWLPRSLIEVHEDGTITLPVWLAHERGLL